MPSFHPECLPAGELGYREMVTAFSGLCGAYERCKSGRNFFKGDKIQYRKSDNAGAGGAKVAHPLRANQQHHNCASFQDLINLRSELAVMEDKLNQIRSVLCDLQIMQRPDLTKAVPVDQLSEIQRLMNKAVAAIPVTTVREPSMKEIEQIFVGSEVEEEESPF